MTLIEFCGCALIAFGPPMTMFCLTVANNPIYIIIMISSCFFWLCALLTSSFLWAIVVPLKETLAFGVIFSVLIQEIFRYLFYYILKKAQTGLQKVSEVGNKGSIQSIRWLSLSYVSGFGFGIMSGAFSLVNVLADATGPGTVGLYGDSPKFFISSAFITLTFILLHTFWGIIFFDSCDKGCKYRIAYVILSHLTVSSLTFFNQLQFYLASLIPCYLITIITGVIAYQCSGGTLKSLKECLPFSLG
ncbi:gamma-secretase subunit Aph-1 isoform X2 [Tetranychus urticae]|uniref:Gamma-secretase subunit Aph-1 n=2 Tax=Tetranychus urticae TaxID=32264 RepID=T1KHJ6_TETUR|nr:gamma-secretase subunit Aph-1 isoform X2 [Tetranychus urticae]